MKHSAYKRLHEQFMQNHNGTTPLETILVITPPAVTILISNCFAVLATRFFFTHVFLIEFCTMVVPLILNSTLLSEHIAHCLVLLSVSAIARIILIAFNSRHKHELVTRWTQITNSFDVELLITNFRGTVNLITAICILAVDFRSFPRRFAKTESYGWGIMDTGVGLFVIANGLVDPKSVGSGGNIKKTLKGCIPMLVLGFLRWISIWWLEYQQHITEYGVHWNFFITLAVTRVASTLLLKITERVLTLAVTCLAIHQTLLSNGLADWVLSSSPRETMFAANREGFCSLLGYISLYLASVALGRWLTTSYLNSDGKRFLLRVSTIAAILWHIAIFTGPPSRRLANLSYVTWLLAYGCTLMLLLLLAQLVCLCLGVLTHSNPYTPTLLAAINYNSLAFFLLSNLLTGVINMSVHTLYVAPIGSVLILIIYMFLVCFTINKLYINSIKLKFW